MSYQNVNVEDVTANELTNQPVPAKKASSLSFTEDYWAVCIAGVIITTILALTRWVPGFKLPLPTYKWETSSDLLNKVLSGNNLLLALLTGIIVLVLSGIAIWLSGGSLKNYVKGFSLIYVLAVIAMIIAGNKVINYYGFEYVIFALILGLLIGNLTTVPAWLKEAARSEFFIKTGLDHIWYEYFVYRYYKSRPAWVSAICFGSGSCLVCCFMDKPQTESGR